MKDHLSWIIPVGLTLLVAFGQMYALTQDVKEMKHTSETKGAKAYERLSNLEYRVDVMERFCCQEKIK